MKSFWMIAILTALASPAQARDRLVTILHTNDIHGRHTPFHVAPGDATAQTGDPGRAPVGFDRSGRIGGFAHLAGKVGEIRRREGEGNILLVDGGDTFSDDFVGNETRGEAVIRLMNALGYQFMALGNHDFDYGLERTRKLQQLARFPMRAANILENGKPIFGRPWQVFEVNGVRVGMLALGYHNSDETGSKDNIRGLDFANGIDATRRYLPQIRKSADIVVLLSHQGTAVDRKLAREVEGVDLIIGAHSHDRITPPEKIGRTWIVQALSDSAALGEVALRVGADKRVKQVEGRVHDLWNDRIEPDPAIARMVVDIDGPYRSRLEEVIAHSADRIGRQYKSESPFDILVGNILRRKTGADVAFMPGVGYGVSIEPGAVSRDRLYTLLPHPTKLVTLEMTGRQILSVLEQSATNLNPANDMDRVGGLIQASGLAWTVNLNRPVGKRVSDVTIGGKPLDPSRWYFVATNAGMVGGLHRYQFKGRNQRSHEQSVTRLVETAFKEAKVIASPPLGSVRVIQPFGK